MHAGSRETAYRAIAASASRDAVIQRATSDTLVEAFSVASERDPALANLLATEILSRLARASLIFDKVEEGVLEVDGDGFIVAANPAATSMLASSRLVGSLLSSIAGDEPDSPLMAAFRGALVSGVTFRRAGSLQAADGVAMPVNVTMAPVPSGVAGPEVLVTFRDATLARARERMLRTNLGLLTRLQTLTGDLPSVARQVVDIGRQELDVESGAWAIIKDNEWRLAAGRSPDPLLAEGITYPLDETYCVRAVEREEMVWVENASETDWRLRPCFARFGLETYIGTPLYVNNELHGMLCFTDRAVRERPFSEREQDIVRLMGWWLEARIADAQA